jgi:arylsulfatase A-like enzyme
VACRADTHDARLEGIVLVPLLKGTAPPLELTLFWRVSMATRQQRSVRSGDWKLLLDGTIQMLFDVRRDPGERNDLAAQRPDIVQKLKPQIEAWGGTGQK